MSSYKERARKRREAEIVKTTARLINEHGYSSLSMDEIAEAVGVSKPTLYQHFKSKDELVVATMLYSVVMMDEHMEEIKDLPPLHQIESTLRYLLESHYDPERFPATLVHETSFHGLDSYKQMIEYQQRLGRYLERLIKHGQEDGTIAATLPPEVIISGLFSMIGVLQGRRMMHRDVDLSYYVEGIVQMFLHGITPVP